jgi:lipopolysaccharide biosynthesis glycosyltransferase
MGSLRLVMALDAAFEAVAAVALSSFLLHHRFAVVQVLSPPGEQLPRLRRICERFRIPFEATTIPDRSPIRALPESLQPYFYCIDALDRLPGSDRVLYVDADTLCVGSLEELEHLPLSPELPFAACSHGRPMPDRQLILGLASPYHYFNAGVLLLEPEPLAALLCAEKVVRYFNLNRALCRFREQCALNALLRERVSFLPSQYNYLSWMRERRSESVWHDLRVNPMAYCLPDVRANLRIAHLSAGALPSKLPTARLEPLDHYWLRLARGLASGESPDSLPRYA